MGVIMNNGPINDGGPAFPSAHKEFINGANVDVWAPGITIRDWFAAMLAERAKYG